MLQVLRDCNLPPELRPQVFLREPALVSISRKAVSEENPAPTS